MQILTSSLFRGWWGLVLNQSFWVRAFFKLYEYVRGFAQFCLDFDELFRLLTSIQTIKKPQHISSVLRFLIENEKQSGQMKKMNSHKLLFTCLLLNRRNCVRSSFIDLKLAPLVLEWKTTLKIIPLINYMIPLLPSTPPKRG